VEILHLTLTKHWFDMIRSRVKREEYREIKPYWTKRLAGGKHFDAIRFRNGYSRSANSFTIALESIETGQGRPQWGAPLDRTVYVLKLGEMLLRE
jgi:hypothetical protein